MTDDGKGRRLWAEDVAGLLQVKPRTVIFSASKTKRKPARQRSLVDVPMPAGRRRRVVETTQGHPRTVISPWWWEEDILACRAARERLGVLGVERAPGGHFIKQAG